MDRGILPMVSEMTGHHAQDRSEQIETAAVHASSHLDPPHNSMKRKLVDIQEAMERKTERSSDSLAFRPRASRSGEP
jgi:hypothetical protein